jgi:geranylgeranyl pyrophosphate synthase
MVTEAGKIAIEADARHGLRGQLASHIMESVGPRGMSLGQLLDIGSVSRPLEKTTEQELDKISWLKTGRAVEMSAVGAALIADPPDADDIISLLTQYSYHMGIAHQVQDDLWDGTKTPEEIGKPTGIDVRNNNPTYLRILGEAAAREKASRHAKAALSVLDGLPDRYNPVKFREIASFIVGK